MKLADTSFAQISSYKARKNAFVYLYSYTIFHYAQAIIGVGSLIHYLKNLTD